MRVFLNLCAGLDRIGVSYRVNDYSYIKRHPDEIACILGKPHVLDKIQWTNPILFGSALHSHPSEDPQLLNRRPVRKVLVPGEWMKKMFEPYYGSKVAVWPVGIDTQAWVPSPNDVKDTDILIYDKVRWEHDCYDSELITPIKDCLRSKELKTVVLRYGSYREQEFHSLLKRAKAMVFLCEHETQGIAYQQALSCGVPILAWDRGGIWKDPSYYPQKVQFSSVTSVPYWDDRCGLRFRGIDEFAGKLDEFLSRLNHDQFSPRDYILDNLTLEKCAQNYVKIFNETLNSAL